MAGAGESFRIFCKVYVLKLCTLSEHNLCHFNCRLIVIISQNMNQNLIPIVQLRTDYLFLLYKQKKSEKKDKE